MHANTQFELTQDYVQELVNKLSSELHTQGAEIEAISVGVRTGRSTLHSSKFGLQALFGGNAGEHLASHDSN